jgi:hypothetical protein
MMDTATATLTQTRYTATEPTTAPAARLDRPNLLPTALTVVNGNSTNNNMDNSGQWKTTTTNKTMILMPNDEATDGQQHPQRGG